VWLHVGCRELLLSSEIKFVVYCRNTIICLPKMKSMGRFICNPRFMKQRSESCKTVRVKVEVSLDERIQLAIVWSTDTALPNQDWNPHSIEFERSGFLDVVGCGRTNVISLVLPCVMENFWNIS
jgi:hypothetical protein